MYHRTTDTSNATKLPLEREAWMLHRFDEHEILRLHLPPGDAIKQHSNASRLIFFVLKGSGQLEIEGQLFELTQEQSIAVRAGKKRGWRNTGPEVLELLVIKSKEESK